MKILLQLGTIKYKLIQFKIENFEELKYKIAISLTNKYILLNIMLKHKFSPLTCKVYIYGCIACTETEHTKKEDKTIQLPLQVLTKFKNLFLFVKYKYTNCPHLES